MFRINKKFVLIFVCASLILILLFSTAAGAVQCEVDKVKENLRKALYLYFTTQNSTLLPVSEIKDLLVFYLSISPNEVAVDCSGVVGSESNKPIFDIVSKGENISAIVPRCSDGTEYGKCSSSKPKYCYAGATYEKCEACGCPSNSVCGKSGKCEETAQNIACHKNIDCGAATLAGDYYCSFNSVYRSLINYTCINAGTANAGCVAVNGSIWIAYCSPSLNQICVNGQNTCQTKTKDNAPAVSIAVSPASVAAGQAFNVAVTGTDDIGLAAIWWWAENATDSELSKAHWYSCNSAKICTKSWLVSTSALGTIKLGANSRDTSYPVAGEAHQASEGAGIAYASIAVSANQTTVASCSWASDNICPSGCAAGSDADCCTQAGKYVLEAHLPPNVPVCQKACYNANYTAGTSACTPCDDTSGYVSDGACPNWCSADNDLDCCANAGKCWRSGQGCYDTCVAVNATTTTISLSSSTTTTLATTTTTPPTACSDGTQNSQCSATKPLYCSNGILTNNCGACGCTSDKICSSSGACQSQACSLRAVSSSITNGNYNTNLSSSFKIWAYSNSSEPEKRYGYVYYSGWSSSGYDGGVWSIGKTYQSANAIILKVRNEHPSSPINFPAGTLSLTIDGSQFNINMPAIPSVCSKCNHWFMVYANSSVAKWPESGSLESWISSMVSACPAG